MSALLYFRLNMRQTAKEIISSKDGLISIPLDSLHPGQEQRPQVFAERTSLHSFQLSM